MEIVVSVMVREREIAREAGGRLFFGRSSMANAAKSGRRLVQGREAILSSLFYKDTQYYVVLLSTEFFLCVVDRWTPGLVGLVRRQ